MKLLLVTTLFIAGLSASLSAKLSQIRQQRRVCGLIEGRGGHVYLDSDGLDSPRFGGTEAPAWDRRLCSLLLRDDFAEQTVRYIEHYDQNIDAQFAKQLSCFNDLRGLNLWGSCIEPASFQSICTLRRLRYLDLGETDVTNFGLRQLGCLDDLTSLSLCGTNVTDDGLEVIAKLHNLDDIDLTQTYKVTEHGVKMLKHARPSIRVTK